MKPIINMKSIRTISPILIAAMIALLPGCSSTTKDKPTQLAEMKAQQAKLAVEIHRLEDEIAAENPEGVVVRSKDVVVLELKPRSFDYFVQTQGAIEAVDNILVSARTMGVISQVFVKEGDEVTKGQTMAQIDNSIVLRNIEEVKSGLELATSVYQRQKNLWDQKIGTEVQYLQARNSKESLEKRLATLHEQLDMSRIKSPIDGSVDEVSLKIGQNAAPGAPAFRVVSGDKLKMKSNVSESYVTSIDKGNKAKLTFSDINKTVEAQITFVGKTINTLSRTFPVEVALPADEDLRPNMTGVLRVIFHTEPAAIVVPVNVVQEINGQKIVYTAMPEGNQWVAHKNIVEVGGIYDNLAEIKKGLASGDKIITTGYQGLNEGEFIKM